MNRRLLWKLCGSVAAGSVLLFWLIHGLSLHAEQRMSFIDLEHQETLLGYARQAETLYRAGDMEALEAWLKSLQAQEQTWAAVVQSELRPLAGSHLSDQFREGFRLGRNVAWKIHLYFEENPIMDVTFADGHTHFLITLPQYMRPGGNWQGTSILLQVVLPLIVLGLLCILIYQHLMSPLRQLEVATRQFSEGRLDVRVRSFLGARKDEIAALADTFDRMADRTGRLIRTQRQLIADLSHELRTPLTRVDVAIDCAEHGIAQQDLLARIRRDCALMRRLVEDTLTLAWLENEQPRLRNETLDLTELLDSILDDARFEYPDQTISVELQDRAVIYGSNHRALGQAIENVIRNALTHQPPGGELRVVLAERPDQFELRVSDQGPGVPEAQLEDIFRPFFRLETAGAGGFGLGLALARRQLEAAGGSIEAVNRPGGGLEMILCFPLRGADQDL